MPKANRDRGEQPAAKPAGPNAIIANSEYCRANGCTYSATGRSLRSALCSLGEHVVYTHKYSEEEKAHG